MHNCCLEKVGFFTESDLQEVFYFIQACRESSRQNNLELFFSCK